MLIVIHCLKISKNSKRIFCLIYKIIKPPPGKIETYFLRLSDLIRRILRIYPQGRSIKAICAALKPHPFLFLLGLFFLIVVIFVAWGITNIREYSAGIYWDSLFCGPSKLSQAAYGVVRIESDDAYGSGFWIADDLILTNNHVVSFQENIKVISGGYDNYQPQIAQTDTLRDLAILRIFNPKEHKILEWRSRWPILTEEVFTLGFPEEANEINITKGIVSSLTSDKFDSTKYIQTDAAINPGNSGGPLTDVCGRVLGITSSTLLDAQNIGFAIDGSRIKKELAEMIIASKKMTGEEIIEGQTGPETEVVAKYYTTVSYGDFENAYELYSKDLKKRVIFKGWKDSYKNTFVIRLKKIRKISPGLVGITFISIDFPNNDEEDLIVREFEGTWRLAKEGDLWKLNYSNIEEISLEKDVD